MLAGHSRRLSEGGATRKQTLNNLDNREGQALGGEIKGNNIRFQNKGRDYPFEHSVNISIHLAFLSIMCTWSRGVMLLYPW